MQEKLMNTCCIFLLEMALMLLWETCKLSLRPILSQKLKHVLYLKTRMYKNCLQICMKFYLLSYRRQCQTQQRRELLRWTWIRRRDLSATTWSTSHYVSDGCHMWTQANQNRRVLTSNLLHHLETLSELNLLSIHILLKETCMWRYR